MKLAVFGLFLALFALATPARSLDPDTLVDEHYAGFDTSYFEATRFAKWVTIPMPVRRLLLDFGIDPYTYVKHQTTQNGRLAATLGVLHALHQTPIKLSEAGTENLTMLWFVKRIQETKDDRVFVILDLTRFEQWREGGGHYLNTDPDKGGATGRWEKVVYPEGEQSLAGSLHAGFTKQLVTNTGELVEGLPVLNVPRIQINFAPKDGDKAVADIDVDGFGMEQLEYYFPKSFWKKMFNGLKADRHLCFANSDPRQWWEKYQKTWKAKPLFQVERRWLCAPDWKPAASLLGKDDKNPIVGCGEADPRDKSTWTKHSFKFQCPSP